MVSWPMVVAGVLLIVLATARFVVDVAYIFVTCINDNPRSGRLVFLQQVTYGLFIAKHALFIISLLIGDLFLVRLIPTSGCLRCRCTDGSATELQMLGCLGQENLGRGYTGCPRPSRRW